MLLLLAYMFVIHFVADFLLQSREMGAKKSSEPKFLFKHLAIQWIAFLVCLAPFIGISAALTFSTLNIIIHGLIDWNIWRGYKAFTYYMVKKGKRQDLVQPADQKGQTYRFWEDSVFFDTIGFDQLLHILTIIGLCALLF